MSNDPIQETPGDAENAKEGRQWGAVSVEGFRFYESRMDPKDIRVLPGMKQYRRSEVTDEVNQVSDALKDLPCYDQATAGALTVWQRDDGSIYVMNGHHRRELAIRTGEESVRVMIFKEEDGIGFEEARGLGALQNVREGDGTALDTALVIKDLGMCPEVISDFGVNLISGVGRDAVSLLKLTNQSLRLVKDGYCPQAVAAGIADCDLDPARQKLALIKAGERGLQTRSEGENIGREIKESQVVVRDDEPEFEVSAEDVPAEAREAIKAKEKAELLAGIKEQDAAWKALVAKWAAEEGEDPDAPVESNYGKAPEMMDRSEPWVH